MSLMDGVGGTFWCPCPSEVKCFIFPGSEPFDRWLFPPRSIERIHVLYLVQLALVQIRHMRQCCLMVVQVVQACASNGCRVKQYKEYFKPEGLPEERADIS